MKPHYRSLSGIFSTVLTVTAILSPSAAKNESPSSSQNRQETQRSDQNSKKEIERFMKLTALNLIELEWNAGYSNRIPNQAERNKAMLSAGLTQCPADFREAWLKQMQNPRRNYAAPLFRKYGVKLANLREGLQSALFQIDPSVRPPIPLYDEGENPLSYDPATCGTRESILKAVATLKAKISNIDPAMLPAWQQSIRTVLIEFCMNYLEAMAQLKYGNLTTSDVERLFKEISVERCPKEFREAWKHDLPFFLQGQFNSPQLQVAPSALRYGVDSDQVMKFILSKMKEWEISTPTPSILPAFLKDMQELKKNLLSNR